MVEYIEITRETLKDTRRVWLGVEGTPPVEDLLLRPAASTHQTSCWSPPPPPSRWRALVPSMPALAQLDMAPNAALALDLFLGRRSAR
jgi:hypothetical protein